MNPFFAGFFLAAVVLGEEGVSTNATTYTYTKLITTTYSGSDFSTYISLSSASNSSTSYYTLNNETFTITDDGYITLTDCPCTFTTESVVTTAYTDTNYASDYWETVNASTYSTYDESSSSESILTGTFIQSTKSSSSGNKMMANKDTGLNMYAISAVVGAFGCMLL